LQGHPGLIADQWISMKVLLADDFIKKANPTLNADLWYAMKGDGYNFGIVTSVPFKIYPRVHTNWTEAGEVEEIEGEV
jgi:hypothetical protein